MLKRGIIVYAIVVTIAAVLLLINARFQTMINNELLSMNQELIEDNKLLLDRIASLQADNGALLDNWLNAEYNAMTRVVTIYCGDE